MNNPKPKKSLLQKGVIAFAIGFFAVMLFKFIGIGGLLRELSRLTALVGLVLIVIGMILKVINKFKS